MSLLYVIGNGFDLWHKLPTSYLVDFKPLVKKRHPKEADLLVRLFSAGDEEDYWSHFEERVGAVAELAQERMRSRADDSLSRFVEEANNDGVTSDDRDFGMQLDDHAVSISSAVPDFGKLYPNLDETLLWRLSPILGDCMNEMAARANERLVDIEKMGSFSRDSYFVTFNYTDTLERVYAVPPCRLFHVHGSASCGDELVWGNERSKVEEEIDLSTSCLALIDKEEPTDYDSGDYRPYFGYHSQYAAVQEGLKSVQEAEMAAAGLLNDVCSGFAKQLNLSVLDCFLESIPGGLDGVIVLGHSLGDVDSPYFERIKEYTQPTTPWSFSFHKLSEVAKIAGVAERLSLSNLVIGNIGRIAFVA